MQVTKETREAIAADLIALTIHVALLPAGDEQKAITAKILELVALIEATFNKRGGE